MGPGGGQGNENLPLPIPVYPSNVWPAHGEMEGGGVQEGMSRKQGKHSVMETRSLCLGGGDLFPPASPNSGSTTHRKHSRLPEQGQGCSKDLWGPRTKLAQICLGETGDVCLCPRVPGGAEAAVSSTVCWHACPQPVGVEGCLSCLPQVLESLSLPPLSCHVILSCLGHGWGNPSQQPVAGKKESGLWGYRGPGGSPPGGLEDLILRRQSWEPECWVPVSATGTSGVLRTLGAWQCPIWDL